VVIGVFVGGRAGAMLQPRVPQHALILAFVGVSLIFAIQMLLRALNG